MEIRSGKNSAEKRYGFRSSGNINHARYDHKQRAREIHVLCPECEHLAQAMDIEADPKRVIIGDLSPSWDGKPFTLACTKCNFTAESLSYAELPKPYHYIEVGKDFLWAYNWGHLDMIIKALEGLTVVGHPYEFFATYIHGNWKKNSKPWLLEINTHIKQSDSTHQFSSKYNQLKSGT